MNTEQLKQMKSAYVRIEFFNEKKEKKDFLYVEVPFSYFDFSELEDYQQEAVCQVELSKLGYGYKIISVDIDRFYSRNNPEFENFQRSIKQLESIIKTRQYYNDSNKLSEAVQAITTNMQNSHEYIDEMVNMICSQDDERIKELRFYGCFEDLILDIINRCKSNSFSDLIERLNNGLPSDR